MIILGIITILMLLTVPGLWAYSFLTDRAKGSMSCSEKWGFVLGLSTVATTLIFIALLVLDIYSVTAVAVAYTALLVLYVALHRRFILELIGQSAAAFKSDRIFSAIFILIFISSTILFFQPTQYLVGGRDPGVYVNTAFQLSRHNRLDRPYEELNEARAEYQKVFKDTDVKFLGFYLAAGKGEDQGVTMINPQFYHGYTIWLAVSHKLFGTYRFLYITPLLALVSLLIFYNAVKEMFNKWTALISALLLSLNISQIWYARSPYTELLSQLMLWLSIYLLVKAYRTKDKLIGAVSGITIGTSIVVRLDSIFFLPPIALFIILIYIRSRNKTVKWAHSAIAGFAASIGLVISYIMTYGVRYTHFQLIDDTPLPDSMSLTALFAILFAAGLLLAILIYLLRKPILALTDWIIANRRVLTTIFGIFTAVIFFYLYFIRPYTPNPDLTYIGTRSYREETLVRIGWFVTRMGVFFSMAGFIYFIRTKFGTEHTLFLLMILTNFTLYLYNPRIFPDQFWAVRRHVPFIIPTFIIFISYAAYMLGRIKAGFIKPWLVTGIITVYFCAKFILAAYPFLFHTEYDGIIAGLDKLAGKFEENAIIITLDDHFAARLVGTPLEYLYDRDVRPLRGTVNQENLYRFMKDKQEEGYPVYLLTDINDSNIQSSYMRYEFLEQVEIAYQMAEPSEVKRPDRVIQSVLKYNIYKPAFNGISTDNLTLDIGTPNDVNCSMEGFYNQEDNGRYDYRWAAGESRISWYVDRSLIDDTKEYTLSLNGARLMPDGDYDPDLYISINGVYIGSMPVTARMQPYEISFPGSLVGDDGKIMIEFRTQAFSPKELGLSEDTRELGFILDSLQIK